PADATTNEAVYYCRQSQIHPSAPGTAARTMDPPTQRRLAAPLLLILVLIAASPAARAWKKDEFRNCNQTPFCKRARTRAPHSLDAPLSLAAGSLSVSPEGS